MVIKYSRILMYVKTSKLLKNEKSLIKIIIDINYQTVTFRKAIYHNCSVHILGMYYKIIQFCVVSDLQLISQILLKK